MELIVCMKQVIDLQHVRIKKETRQPILEGLPLVLGDMDKNALEASIRIREKYGGKVTVLSLGSPKLKDTILEALAMGADEAIILTDQLFSEVDSMGTAKVLAKAIKKIGKFDLVMLGEGSNDNYSGQTGPRLAEILDVCQITYVRELEIEGNRIKAVRSMEECFEVVEASLPALVTVTSEINVPRIPSLTQILKASKKPLHNWKIDEIGISMEELQKLTQVINNLAPKQERKEIIFEGETDEVVGNLINSLIKEGVIH